MINKFITALVTMPYLIFGNSANSTFIFAEQELYKSWGSY